MKKIYFIFSLCLVSFVSLAESPDTGEEIQFCYDGSKRAENSVTPAGCMEAKREAAEKAMQSQLNKLKEHIRKNFDDPYHLNDEDGETIARVFLQHLSASQNAWIKSRDDLCLAAVSLMGEWASSRNVAMSQCIINLNKSRIDELESYFLTGNN
ncbi:uncharacterized protein YecT (DUF1311 family) [Pantoea alhagi]|uniref:lysozyme inhibitor LprI family protein n=1 Tax=Mixta sp. BE291 TaxID=3158787 RepID=UPI00285B31C7|nr:uncharacterized protein YecT (DUF1311 family) [Pantoea alhagi]